MDVLLKGTEYSMLTSTSEILSRKHPARYIRKVLRLYIELTLQEN
jgi:hypothetical protein